MKTNPNFEPNRWLTVGVALNLIYLCVRPLELQSPLALLGFMEGVALALMLFGLLLATPKGRAIADRVCRFKRSLFGKGDV